jgi:hypothetical protein
MSLDSDALATLVAGYRSLADQLEEFLKVERAIPEARPATAMVSGAVFDPEHDVPPVTPKVHGTREEQDWCVIVFFGRLRALNVRQGRGADQSEQRALGNAAGYKGRVAFNGWTWTWKDRADGRWITDDDELTGDERANGRTSGMGFLREYVKRRNVVLPEDLA